MLCAKYITHSFSRHTHEGYAIGVIESGVEAFTYRGAIHQAPAGSIVIIHPGEVHTGHAGIPEGWSYRMLYPDAALLQQAAAEVNIHTCSLPFFSQPVIQDKFLAQQLQGMHRAIESSDVQLERESRFLWTLAQLIARYADDRPLPAPLSQEHAAVENAKNYLEMHFAESVSLNHLAQRVNLKPLRLLRVFQREVGLPPHAFLIQIRVVHAKRLLAMGEPIAQVAFDTGFTDQSHLNRHFKRLVGVTPGQYAAGCLRRL
ncbi:AraC family transcriptional regulator [filamentous cyanobacterium CCP1]|nr:AraC family transcriptional regulator [filamentous cyanobacterium CCP2]PSB67935.1 AraC family transcriptional regulator [filamentous cyanobacterium CCP1]